MTDVTAVKPDTQCSNERKYLFFLFKRKILLILCCVLKQIYDSLKIYLKN